jgi:DNA-binding CsgD family transcriptional regulator
MLEAQRFVGRTRELADLHEEWRRASAGAFRVVLLIGEPGVGKTRLADEAVARLSGPTTSLEARARRLGATASFGLWVDALERHLRTYHRDEISALCDGYVDDLACLLRSVAALRGRAPETEPPRPRLLGSLGGLLTNLAAPDGLRVVLNDMHLADPSSWDVLPYLAEHFADAPVLVLATVRPGEMADNPTAWRAVLDLEDLGALTRLEIGPLDDVALAELAADVMGGTVEKSFLDWLWDRTRGNPLYAGYLLRAARDEGIDRRAPGLRHLPEELSARVRLRVEHLDRSARDVLEILAVAGGSVELADLLRFTDAGLDALVLSLDGLVRSRLVTELEHGHVPAYEISHPLIQETIYEQIGGARRFAVHRRVARHLLVTGRLGEAAGHFARSGERGDDEAIAVLLEALRQAEQRGAYQEALGILSILVDLVPARDRRWESVADALSRDADWVVDHRADADAQRAVAALREIDSVLADSADVARRATVKSRLTSFLSWGTGEMAAAAVAAEEAVMLHQLAGAPTKARIAALELAYARGLAGDLAAFYDGAGRSFTEAQQSGDAEAVLWAAGVRGAAAFYRGQFAEAEDVLRFSINRAHAQHKPYRVTRGLLGLGWTLGFQGRLPEAYAAFEEAKATPGWRESNVLEVESLVRWLAGDYRGSMQCAHEVVMLNAGRIGLRRGLALTCIALSGAELGELGEAHEALAGTRALYGSRPWFFVTGVAQHAEGIVAWREGRLAQAADLLARAGTELQSFGAPAFAAFVLADAAELAHEQDDVDVARDAALGLESIAVGIDRPLFTGMAATARAWAALTAGRPSAAADAAESAAETLSGLPYPALLARADLVLGLAREGRDPEVSVARLSRAAERYDQLGASWRRDRALARLKRLGRSGRRAAEATLGVRAITSRELEVARLAARRLSAAEIAAQLCISRRTVETHLASVYAKVGINSRGELADRLAELV